MMYCKMYVIANCAILKKNNVCKILVELYSAILVRFSIFSIQVALIVQKVATSRNPYGTDRFVDQMVVAVLSGDYSCVSCTRTGTVYRALQYKYN